MIVWNKYYTPIDVAKKIVNLIPDDYRPELIVDICYGSGNFLKAGLIRWNVQGIGVDEKIFNIDEHNNILKYEFNSLEYENLEFLKSYSNKLILANPPFGKLDYTIKSSNESFQDLLALAINSKRMEACMLVSNLSILNNGDVFSAIIPENIFTSQKMENFKKLFFSYFDTLYLSETELFFNKCEVRTRIFIGVFNNDPDEIEKKYNVNNSQVHNKKCLSVFRGIDNSLILKSSSIKSYKGLEKIIHFSGDTIKENLLCYIKSDLIKKRKVVRENDILISRVGRNSGKVFFIENEYEGYIFSDYFYVLTNHDFTVSDSLKSTIENKLNNRIRGLTTKYISKKDIIEVIESLG